MLDVQYPMVVAKLFAFSDFFFNEYTVIIRRKVHIPSLVVNLLGRFLYHWYKKNDMFVDDETPKTISWAKCDDGQVKLQLFLHIT